MTSNKFMLVFLAAVLLAGCTHIRYTAPEVVPVDLLTVYKQDNAEIPVKLQLVNFSINSVEANYSDEDKEKFKRFNASHIPNIFNDNLGQGRIFSEVRRTETPKKELADYILYGTYDFSEDRTNAPFYHSISINGILHVTVERTKDNVKIIDKDFVEERMDNGASFQAIRVLYLQQAFLLPIAAEVKKAIAQDVSMHSGSSK